MLQLKEAPGSVRIHLVENPVLLGRSEILLSALLFTHEMTLTE